MEILDSIYQDFKKSKDRLFKALEDNPVVLAWAAWAVSLFKPELSYREMLDYVRRTSGKELESFFDSLPLRVQTVEVPGIEMDHFLKVDGEGAIDGFFDLENQSEDLKAAVFDGRSDVYVGGMVFSETRFLGYGNLRPVALLWLMLLPSGKNENIIIVRERLEKVSGYDSNGRETGAGRRDLNQGVYSLYLGPSASPERFLGDSESRPGRLRIAQEMFNLFIDFQRGVAERGEDLRRYYGFEKSVEETMIETNSAMEEIRMVAYKWYGDELKDKDSEIDQLKDENSQQRDEIKAKDSQLEAKDSELEAKDRELEAKDSQLEAKDSEINRLREEIKALRMR